ncbi:hypothetical protein [Phocaeicola sp.]
MEVRNTFKRFEGRKVQVTITSAIGVMQDKVGFVEIDEEWAYLYQKTNNGNKYTAAINTRKNNVITIITLD